ncbi:MAG TPA: hypothetical protein VGN80_01905 [Devosiaceae bacterium]|jgi:hypothetical protein|nr:hypothetical protein [Devosiaceae bacterium]
MTYILTYTDDSGGTRRIDVPTAENALTAYSDLRRGSATEITVRNGARLVTYLELMEAYVAEQKDRDANRT